MNEWEYRDDLDWEESQNAEQTELLKKDYRKKEAPPQTSHSPKKGYISRQDEERKRRFRPSYVPIYERFERSSSVEEQTSTNLNNSYKGKRGYISRQDEERKRRFRPGYVPIYERHLVDKLTEEKSTPEEKAQGDRVGVVRSHRSTAPKSSELLLARINPNTKQQEQEQPLNVANLSATEKLGEAMKRAALKLPKAVGEQLLAMVNPTSLFIMVGVLGAYAASHAVGIGVIADAVMAVGAGATIGWQVVSAGKDLWGFAQFINATTEEDLDKAGQHLANFITTIGIDIVIGILTKKAAGKVKGAGNLDEAEYVNAGRANGNTRIEIENTPVSSIINENYKFINPTGNWSRELGINHYKTGKIIKQMSSSEIGQRVVDAVNADDIDLSLSLRNDIPRNLLGISTDNYGTAYVYNTQSYDQTVLTLIHEGLHAMGIGGSRRAEALVRLAELEHQGIPINRKTIRQVLTEMKETEGYNHMPWRIGGESPNFPGVEF